MMSLVLSNIIVIFAMWIGGNCNPSDKGMLTTLPRFYTCQQNFINVSNMLRFEDLPKVNSERWLSLEDLDGEIWRDVPSFEDCYKVSNYGRLKSLKRKILTKKGYVFSSHDERILSSTSTNGYFKRALCKDGKLYHTSIHRIVALAFISNEENKPCIDHIDGNRQNNCVYNLRWCSVKENMNNSITTHRISKARKGKPMSQETKKKISQAISGKRMGALSTSSKPINQFDFQGNLIKRWDCAADAERMLNVHRSLISMCCHGKSKSHAGYRWQFA